MSIPMQPADEMIIGPDGNRSVYKIPERNFPKFEKQMESLSRRSQKLGFPPIKPIPFSHEQVRDGRGNPIEDAAGRPLYLIEVYLSAEMPRVDGWTFVARIDHANEVGNIIRSVPNCGVELPAEYRTKAPECDHCRINRKRRDTFVLRCDATGEFKQVGSSCLVDFFGGNDPYKVAKLAELLGYAEEAAKAAEQSEFVMRDRRWIDIAEYLNYVAAAIRVHGWVPKSWARSSQGRSRATCVIAMEMMFPNDLELAKYRIGPTTIDDAYAQYRAETVTAQDEATAREALEWARGLADQPDINTYLHNISVIANSFVMESRSIGLCASIIAAKQRSERDARQQIERAEREAAREAARKAEEAARAAMNTDVGDFSSVISLMKGETTGSKIRFAKIWLQLEDKTPVVLNMAGPGASRPGTVNVTNGAGYGQPNNIWFGRVTREGKYEPNRKADYYTGRPYVPTQTAAAVSALLSRLAADPVRVAAEYGKLTGNCCMCGKKLTDARSAHVGYGKRCAENAGWPYPTNKEVKVAMGVA